MGPQAVREDPRRDAHAHELLEEQLARVRDAHLVHLAAAARLAPERLRLQVGDGDEPALVAHVDAVRLLIGESINQAIGRSVGRRMVRLVT